MTKSRRKVSAVFKSFESELNRLEKFDSENQSNFSSGTSPVTGFKKKQLHLMTESIFLMAYREYENYVRDIFVLYCMGKPRKDNTKVNSYVKPRDFEHAEALLKSSMPFLDWTSPDTIIKRSETYLKDGGPIRSVYVGNTDALRSYKRIRNHIAHNSKESLSEYKKVVRVHYGTIPLTVPTVGEYLLLPNRNDSSSYYLQSFFKLIRNIASLTA